MKLIFLLLLPSFAISQTTYTGTVLNRETKQGIPYATIGLVRKNIGVNADEQGRFLFNSAIDHTDTFVVSSVGYETLKLAVNRATKPVVLELNPKLSELKEVTVTGRYSWKYNVLGAYSKCGLHSYGQSESVSQLAKRFTAPESNTLLSRIDMCKYGILIIDPVKARCRIRIYAMDSVTVAPSLDLCNQIIEVEVKGSHISVDLDKYHIVIPGKDFFVAIEWLKIRMNENQRIMKLPDGRKYNHMSYHPSLAIEEFVPGRDSGCWELDYKGKWYKSHFSVIGSATVKY